MALERKEAAKDALRDQVWKTFELGQALKSPDSSKEDRKAHAEAQKMVEHFRSEVKQRDVEIGALEEEEKALGHSIEALKNL